MADDEAHTYHHRAREGEAQARAGMEPHHALNTPVDAIDAGDTRAVLASEEEAGERRENVDDRAQDGRTNEERARRG